MPEEFADKILEWMNGILDAETFKKYLEQRFEKNFLMRKLTERAMLDVKDQVYQYCQNDPEKVKEILRKIRGSINQLLGET